MFFVLTILIHKAFEIYLSTDEDFIKQQINQLDDSIAQARLALKKADEIEVSADERKQRIKNVLQAKIKVWVEKRDLLLQLLINPLRKKG
jgi:hypothetical protein